jgi:ethanolamine transporter
MFAGTILACDMGGGPVAVEMSGDPEAAMLGGVITGSMLGATLVFTIPAAMGILRQEDRTAMAKGILCGIVTIPVGIFVGGLVAGFHVRMVLRNLLPIVVIAVLIALGLWKAERGMIRGFVVFGKGVAALITAGLAVAVVEALTGFALIPGMAPVEEGFQTVGAIAIVLAGAFPLVYTVTKLFRKPLMKLGSLLKVNDVAAAGLVATLANSIATLGMVKDMDRRGRIVNAAFFVCAASALAAQLGFTAGVNAAMLPVLLISKLAGGCTGIIIALLATKKAV